MTEVQISLHVKLNGHNLKIYIPSPYQISHAQLKLFIIVALKLKAEYKFYAVTVLLHIKEVL